MKDVPFFPHQLVRELALSCVVLGLLLVLAALLPAPLGERAVPGEVREVSPPWYLSPLFGFLTLWQMTVGGSLSIAVLVPVLVLLLIFLLPFIDRREEGAKERRMRILAGGAFVLMMLFLAYMAYSADFESYAVLLP